MRNKYNATKTIVDQIKFDSKKEANRYLDLKLMQRAKLIESLELQPRFDFILNGVKIAFYKADFRYICIETGKTVVEDVKGFQTAIYRLKKKMMKAFHNIEIKEIT